MPITSARTGFHFAAPVFAVVVLSSCGSQGTRASAFFPVSSSVVSQTQIAATGGVSAYDAIHQLRPNSLNIGGVDSRAPTIYLDGMRLGGVSELQRISASGIAQIRFFNPVEAGAFFGPTWQGGGAIVLTTRPVVPRLK